MVDVLSPQQRAYCMSQINGRNTKPEIAFRKSLWAMGFRHRVKSKLSGKPDIVYPALKIVIFVDGCFCRRCSELYQRPNTRAEFWEDKISGNVDRDRENDHLLKEQGWIVIRVWEHEIKAFLADCIGRLVTILPRRKAKYFPTNGLSKN